MQISQAGDTLASTHCNQCALGLISHGNGGKADERGILKGIMVGAGHKYGHFMQDLDLTDTKDTGGWSDMHGVTGGWSDTKNTDGLDLERRGKIHSPWVIMVEDGYKQLMVPGIIKWWATKAKISISDDEVYFYDDRNNNVMNFEGTEYNANQISCGARDEMRPVGYCGATTQEISKKKGVHTCVESLARGNLTSGTQAETGAMDTII